MIARQRPDFDSYPLIQAATLKALAKAADEVNANPGDY
jgi:hypothetical protein